MTQQEALQIFQLSDAATTADIEARYRDRYNAIQQQLRNAPDHLRTTFERNLTDLQKAYAVLTVGNVAMLPSERPVPIGEQAANVVATASNMAQSTPSVSEPISEPNLNKRDAERLEKLKKQQTYWLLAVIGLAAVLSFFAVQWFEKKGELDKAKPKAEKYDKLEKEWFNRKFSIRNAGSKPFKVLHYLVCYLDEAGNLKELEDNADELVEPNRTYSIQKTEGKKQIFEGKAVFYSIIVVPVNDAAATPVSFSGLLKAEGDTPINAD